MIVLTLVAVLSSNLEELRYCGPPQRDASGTIVRSSAVVRAFRKAHPCPVTGKTDGACAGWAVDHVHPARIVRLRCCLEFTVDANRLIKSWSWNTSLKIDGRDVRFISAPGEAD
jgi:hypothetical protein